MLENSRAKLRERNTWITICANDVKESGAGFQVDTNSHAHHEDDTRQLPLLSKGGSGHGRSRPRLSWLDNALNTA